MTNNEIKYYEKLKQKKYRDLENKFLIEGIHLIKECLNSNFYKTNLEKIFVRNSFDMEAIPKNINSNIEILYLEEKKFNKLSETVNSQGIIGVVNKYFQKPKIQNVKPKITLALDKINDPGNLGTILRTCYWFGVDQVLISRNSVDLYSSKVIRSSQGAIFNIEIITEVNLEVELNKCYKNDFEVFLTDANAHITLDKLKHDDEKNIILVFGNEAHGISEEILSNDNYSRIKIKGFSDCESLNVAVTTGIVLNSFKNTQANHES